MRRLDFNLLVTLDALLDERSVTRAARRLGLTQSTVSGMLARLRAALGDPLFVRSQHGIVPTRRASALAAPLKKLIADAKVITTAERFDPATASQTFSVSLNDYMQLTVLLPLVADLRRQAAGIRLSVRPLVVDDLVADLARGEIDLVVTIPEFAMSDLPSRLLYRETYVGVVRREHPLAGRHVSIDDFCRFDHVLVSPTRGSFEGPTDDALRRAGWHRRTCYSVPSFLLLPALLQTDNLIAVVPRRLTAFQPAGLVSFKLPVSVKGFDVIAVWHARVDKDPAHQWLRSKLARIARAVQTH
jgi:DNA-binding transcriptional LysR family regulator